MIVKLRVILAKVRLQLYCRPAQDTQEMESAGETGEGLKDELIIFQFFPRESSQQRGAVPGTAGSWQPLSAQCAPDLCQSQHPAPINDTIFHTPPQC